MATFLKFHLPFYLKNLSTWWLAAPVLTVNVCYKNKKLYDCNVSNSKLCYWTTFSAPASRNKKWPSCLLKFRSTNETALSSLGQIPRKWIDRWVLTAKNVPAVHIIVALLHVHCFPLFVMPASQCLPQGYSPLQGTKNKRLSDIAEQKIWHILFTNMIDSNVECKHPCLWKDCW